MEAQFLLRFLNEHHVSRNVGDALRKVEGPLDYLKVTLRCRSCGSSRDFSLRDCVGVTARCTCGSTLDHTGVDELITRVAAIGSLPARASASSGTAFPHGQEASAKQFVILLVEDDAASELLTIKCIQRSDICCDIHVAHDGKQAVEYVNDINKPRPDLVLLDLSMPVMDGFEVLRTIRADDAFRFLPIVMLTTSSQPESVEESFALGANGYVVKGASLSKFRDDVAATLRYWLLASLRPPADYAVRSGDQSGAS